MDKKKEIYHWEFCAIAMTRRTRMAQYLADEWLVESFSLLIALPGFESLLSIRVGAHKLLLKSLGADYRRPCDWTQSGESLLASRDT